MILLEDVYKRYRTPNGVGKWVLSGISLTIPKNCNVGLIGANGAGKSTLLRLIGGIDEPSKGRVDRQCRVSWPLGLSSGQKGTMTGRQNAKFLCRLYGRDEEMSDRLAFIQDFCELGDAFDEPVKTYSKGMRARLNFALSLAFDFEVYLVDELTSVGDTAFRKKAQKAFKNLAGHAGLIMVSHNEKTIKKFCSAGIWLHNGKTQWFDDVNEALRSYEESIQPC
jgi:capsular polysaccharide transport system ATP-binding protein